MEYFSILPIIEYCDTKAVNILARAKIREYLLNNTYVYLPYVVKEYDRPDVLSNNYYGHWKYTWIIFYTNQIFDPSRDWVLNQTDFIAYLNNKYERDEILDIDYRITLYGYPEYSVDLTTYEQFIPGTGESKRIVTDPEEIDGFRIANTTIKEFRLNFNNEWFVVDFKSFYEMWIDPEINRDDVAKVVSNFEYEENINEDKRQIKLLSKEFLPQLVNEFKSLFGK